MIALLPTSEGLASHDYDGRWADWHNYGLPVILSGITVIAIILTVRGLSGSENKVTWNGGSTEGNIRHGNYVPSRYRLRRRLWFSIVALIAPFTIFIMGIALPRFVDTGIGAIIVALLLLGGFLWHHYLGMESNRHLYTGIAVAGANALIIIGLWGWYWSSFDSTPFDTVRAQIGLG